jgi:hypothetical protein
METSCKLVYVIFVLCSTSVWSFFSSMYYLDSRYSVVNLTDKSTHHSFSKRVIFNLTRKWAIDRGRVAMANSNRGITVATVRPRGKVGTLQLMSPIGLQKFSFRDQYSVPGKPLYNSLGKTEDFRWLMQLAPASPREGSSSNPAPLVWDLWCFSSSMRAFPCQYNSTNATY